MIEAIVAWALTPISGADDHAIEPVLAWHGRLMVASWGVILPVGVTIARYFKVTPRQDWPRQLDNKFWFYNHRRLQWLGVATMSLALVFALQRSGENSSAAASAHRLIGWMVVAAGWTQVAATWFRGTKGGPTEPELRGDHYDMTPRRVAFEALHKCLGWTAIAFAAAGMFLGLVITDAPRWMPLTLALWWIVYGASAGGLQAKGWRVDTYRAIWGPDPSLPGNRRASSRFNVSRRSGRARQ